jgi:hypothetical protein
VARRLPSTEIRTLSGSGEPRNSDRAPLPYTQSVECEELIWWPTSSGGNQPPQKMASSRGGSGNGGAVLDRPRTNAVTAPSLAVGLHPLATSPRQAIQAVSATTGLST